MELGSGDSPAFPLRHRSEAPILHLHKLRELRKELERRQRLSRSWLTNLKYPLAMLLLLLLTGLVGLMVVSNALQLLVGFKRLPSYRQYVEIGNTSLNKLGIFGATIEIVTILYMMLASLVGLYSVPILRALVPRRRETSMTKVILNSMAVLVLSSALPVLARTLGMSNFDLLGDFGRLDWLGNFYLVWGYNLVFLALTALALINTFTARLRRELWARLRQLSRRVTGARQRHRSSDMNGEAPDFSHSPKDKSL